MNTIQYFPMSSVAAEYIWVFEIIAGILGLVFLHGCFKHLVKIIRQRALAKEADWKHQLDHILLSPIRALFLVVGIYYVIYILGTRFGFQGLTCTLKPFRDSLVIFCLAWISLRWKKEFLQFHHRQLKGASPGMASAFNKLLSIVIGVLTTLIVLGIFNLDIMPLLAFGGIGAAAVGFAAKDVIANFFGGLMLSITRPFMEGDWIILPHHKMEGSVEQVGWYLTAIRDKDKRPIYLPNSIFSNVTVINASRMTHRRINEIISIRYIDFAKLNDVTQQIKDYVLRNNAIDKEAPVLVFFQNFGTYSLDVFIDIYTLTTRWDAYLAVKEEVLKNVYKILEQNGVEIPYPTSTVKVIKEEARA